MKVEEIRSHADVCQQCNGTGWKTASSGSDHRVTRCDCRLQARSLSLLAAARIPKRYEHCELSNFEFDGPHRSLAPARMSACRFVEEYPLDGNGAPDYWQYWRGQDSSCCRNYQGIGYQQGRSAAFSTIIAISSSKSKTPTTIRSRLPSWKCCARSSKLKS